ncbi:MAG: hypothetical protein IJX88_02475 [Clostridia bacterium]|nr:hypothetical protein [Clostridia bacterium]
MWWNNFFKTFAPCGKCAAIALCIGAVCFAVSGIITLARKIKARKYARAQTERALQFTLPDRDNAYVRERLNNALCLKDEETIEGLDLSYARALLTKVASAPLTKAESLEISEIAGLFELCLKKERFTASDVRLLSDAFGRILKLSAKYSL